MAMKYMWRWRWVLAVFGLLACSQAYALDMEYYVYNGFDDALAAFQRLALIFSDNNYITLFTAFIVLAIVLAATSFAARGLTGGPPTDIRSWAFPIIFGVVVFRGLLLATGTIHLYDPVRNENQAIGGVPDMIIVVAGTLNLVERSVEQVVDTGSAYPYANDAGGITYDLIYRATAEWNDVNSFYYTQSLGQYFVDCGLPALNSQAYNVTMDQLKRGTMDFRQQLGAMAGVSNYTTYYDASNKAGTTMTCATDWQLNLSPFLNDAASFTDMMQSICSKAGLNMNSLNQQQKCQSLLADAATQAQGGTAVDAITFMRQAYIASAIDRVMQSKDPDLAQQAIANRNLMIQGIGMGNSINEWLPTMRAVALAIILGMIPVVALFIVTPLFSKALMIVAGLLVWYSLWGITDVITHQMAMDGAQRVFLRITQYNLGLDSIWLMPDAATKSLAYFGQIRGMSVMIATALSGMLFKFGGSMLAGVAQEMAATATAAAGQGALATQTVEGRGQLRNALVQGEASELTRTATSFGQMTSAAGYHQMTSVRGTGALIESAERNGMSMAQLSQTAAAAEGGQAFGGVQSIINATKDIAKEQGRDQNSITTHDVANTASLIAEAHQTQRSSSARAFHDVMVKLGNGDATAGAMRYAGIEATQKATNLDNVATLAEKAQNELISAGSKPSKDGMDGYRALAQVMMSGTEADLATFGTPDQLAEFLHNNRSLDKGRIAAMAAVAEKHLLSVESLGATAGRMEAAMRMGDKQALESMGIDSIAAGFEYRAAQQGATGDFWKQWVGKRDEGKLYRDIAAFHGESDLAKWQTATLAAEKLNTPRQGYLFQSEGSNLAVAVSGQKEWSGLSQEFIRDGVISQEQADMVTGQLQGGNGGVVRFGFDPTSKKGVQMTFQGGSSVSHEQNISDVSSNTIGQSINRNIGTALLQPGSPSEVKFRQEMPELFDEQHKQLFETYKTDLAAPLHNIGRFMKEGSLLHTVSDSQDAGLHTPPWLGKATGIQAGASVSHSDTKTLGEHRNIDSARGVVDNLMTQAWQEATEHNTYKGVTNTAARDKEAADIFLRDYRAMYSYISDYAKDKASDAELTKAPK